MKYLSRLFTIVLVAGVANSASADIITAQYAVPAGYLLTSFQTNLPGPSGVGLQANQGAALIQGLRTDVAGPGVDSSISSPFPSYCVEIGEGLSVAVLPSYGPAYTHTVTDLGGSVTSAGGISGPVNFTASLTDRLQLLWGTFQPTLSTNVDHAAFQVAVWKIAFDTNLNLFDNTSAMYYAAPDAISLQAQGYLTVVGTGVGPRQSLKLLSGANVQDLITVPAPGSAALLGLAGMVVARRRRA